MSAARRPPAEILAVVLAAVVVMAIYGAIAGTAVSELGSRSAGEDYYNRLSDGFARGQASLDLAAPSWLTALPDPYDPAALAPFQGERYAPGRIHDLSYYHGKLYLYFSAVPAVVLFLPFHALTGAFLSHHRACFLFCCLGFSASALLLDSIRRRCFPAAGVALAAIGTLAVGLIPVVPLVLERSDVWEVPITAAYGFWMLSLLLLWAYWNRPAQSWPWLAGLSTAVGLAIGCRPSGALGGALLLLPLWRLASSPAPKRWGGAAALLLPIAGIGAALLAYNQARFGDVLEFGQRYQLSGGEEASVHRFSLGFIWYNFRLYFLEYPGWDRGFPFVRQLVAPVMPAGHRAGDNPVGVLTLLPFLLCAAAVPLAFAPTKAESRPALTAIVGGILLVFAANAGPLCLFISTCLRYELEFVPALTLLAVLGFFALASGAEPGNGRRVLAGAGTIAAAASIAFNLLMAASLRANTDAGRGLVAAQSGQTDQAVAFYRSALRLRPATRIAQVGLADMLVRQGKLPEASAELQKAIELWPDAAEIRLNEAYCLYQLGRVGDALAECEVALKLEPDSVAARQAEQQLRLEHSRAP